MNNPPIVLLVGATVVVGRYFLYTNFSAPGEIRVRHRKKEGVMA